MFEKDVPGISALPKETYNKCMHGMSAPLRWIRRRAVFYSVCVTVFV